MTNNQREIALRNMSKYILQGAEMLKDSCPNCHVPLLKLKGKTFCGGCNKEVVYATEETAQEIEHKMTYDSESKTIIRTTETILLGKLENVTNQMIAQQKEELQQSLELIDQIMSLLIKINDFQKGKKE